MQPHEFDLALDIHNALVDACRAAIPCLEDWVRSTGFGEVHRRDKEALNLCYKALKLAGLELPAVTRRIT